MHQGKDVIGEACRVGVVFLDAQVGLVVQQAVKYIGRVAHADIDHLGVERRVLVGYMGVEGSPRAAAIFRVDVTGTLGLAPGSEVLAVRR